MYNVLFATANPGELDMLSTVSTPVGCHLISHNCLTEYAQIRRALREDSIDILILDSHYLELLLHESPANNAYVSCILLSDSSDTVCPQSIGAYHIRDCLLRPLNSSALADALVGVINKHCRKDIDSSQSSVNLQYLLDHTLTRWILGSIRKSELDDWLISSGIPLDPLGYTVALIHTFNGLDSLSYAQKKAILNICKHALPGSWAIPPIFDLSDNVVLISPQTAIAPFLSALESITNSLVSFLGKHVFSSIGIQAVKREDVHKSYESALIAIAHCQFESANRIVSFTSIENELLVSPGDSRAFKLVNLSFESLLLNKQYQQCMSYLDVLFSPDSLLVGYTPAFLRNQSIELAVCISNALRSHSIDISRILDNDITLFHKIISFDSIHDLFSWMRDFLMRSIELLENVDTHYSPCVARTVEYIKANYMLELSLKTVASDFKINAAYLGQLFKSETTQSFSVFLNETRIENAKKMLLGTNLTLSVISQRCGYPNTSYFYNIFKKHTGQTPSQYRRSRNTL